MRTNPLFCVVTVIVTFMLLTTCSLASERTLYVFPGGNRGTSPQTGVIFDTAGNMYGTTYYGGTYGWGVVYELQHGKHGWKEQVLYNFAGLSDGTNPVGNLVMDAAGNLYGTTLYGGTGTGCQQGNYACGGTIFELASSKGKWKHIILYSFCSLSGCSDGAAPSGLTLDEGGKLYGTTVAGGQGCPNDGCGTVYRLTPSNGSWTETVLHRFDSSGDGFFPGPGATVDQSGHIFGTTYAGGRYNHGTVFELKPRKQKWSEVILYSFTGGSDGGANGGLFLDQAGNLFGTTGNYGYGCRSDCGSVFELTPVRRHWVKTTVYTFDGLHGTGPNPYLIKDQAGNFYGSCFFGGKNDAGVIFQLKPGKSWKISVLYNLPGKNGMANPNAGLVFGPDSGLYATAPSNSFGQYDGFVFEVSVNAHKPCLLKGHQEFGAAI